MCAQAKKKSELKKDLLNCIVNISAI